LKSKLVPSHATSPLPATSRMSRPQRTVLSNSIAIRAPRGCSETFTLGV
jgi:hypothetical protein